MGRFRCLIKVGKGIGKVGKGIGKVKKYALGFT